MKKFLAAFVSAAVMLNMFCIATSALGADKISSVFEQDDKVTVADSDLGIVCTSSYKYGGFMYNAGEFDLTNGFSVEFKISDNTPYFVQQQDGTLTSDIKYSFSFGAQNKWWGDNTSFAAIVRPLDDNTTLLEAQFIDTQFTWVARQGFAINPKSSITLEVKKVDGTWFMFLNGQIANQIDISNFGTRFLDKCTGNKGYFGYGHAYEQGGNTPISCTIRSINQEKFYSTTVDPTGVSLSSESLSLNLGETNQLTANVLPDNATDKNITWESSDSNIATVSNTGLVKAIAVGTAEITAKTTNNITTKCVVTVKKSDLGASNFINKLDPNQNPAPTLTDTNDGVKISSTQVSGGFVFGGKSFDLNNGFNVNLQLNDVPAYFNQQEDGVISSDIWYAISFGSTDKWWVDGNNVFGVLIRPLSATKTGIEAQYQDSDGFTWIARQEFDINPQDKLKLELKKDSGVWYLFLNGNKADKIDVSKFDSRFLAKCSDSKAYMGYGYFYAQNSGKTVSATISNVNDVILSSYDPNTLQNTNHQNTSDTFTNPKTGNNGTAVAFIIMALGASLLCVSKAKRGLKHD